MNANPVAPSAAARGVTRRKAIVAAAPAALLGASLLPACSPATDPDGYAAVAAQIRRPPESAGTEGASHGTGRFGDGLGHRPSHGPSHEPSHGPSNGWGHAMRELVRFATLAPSSHNSQCWLFAPQAMGLTIRPDLSRRCPAVDPDDHHVFVSLGCALENLALAARARGLDAEGRFDVARDTIDVAFAPAPAQASPLFEAIVARQCTRGDYDGRPLSLGELKLLEQAGTATGVRMLLLTERPAMERVLAHVIEGNTAQMADPAFVAELKAWIRFNGTDAVRTRDGLFSASSGSPAIPGWLGDLAFGWFLSAKGENEKYARQIRSSAGIAVFVGEKADKAHWVEVGRCYERFALQATALGIRNAFLNQPVEVAAMRPPFAEALGLGGQRPDLVVRFGRGPTLPASLRRPVESVMV